VHILRYHLSTPFFPVAHLTIALLQPKSSSQAKSMDHVIKKFYIIFLIETLLLAFILLWSPSEAGNQILLGRSLLRWVVAFPAILFLLAGLTIFCIKPWQEELISFHTIKKIVISWNGRTGEYLILSGIAVLFFILTLLWGANKTGRQDILVRIVPWLIFAGILFVQFSYLLIKTEEEHENPINLQKSFTRIPLTLKHLLLNEKVDKPVLSENISYILYGVAIAGLVFVFLFEGYFFLKFAGLNSDEGWYLYAARQVYRGDHLYQDFAFTQMPLLPYIYGLGQLIHPSIYTGRIVSLVIFGAGISLAMVISWKHFSKEASLWLLIIILTNATGFYFSTIVKTYSLTLFFMTFSLFIWMSTLKAEIKYPCLSLVLFLGCFTRQTFIIYALVIQVAAVVEIWKLKDRAKIYWRILAWNAPLVVWGLSFFYPNPRNFIWDIFTYNADVHGLSISESLLSKYMPHVRNFLETGEAFWPIGIPLVLSICSSVYYKNINRKRNQRLFIAFIGTLCFIFIHFIGALPLMEYYVPPIMFLMTLIILFLFSFSEHKSNLNGLILWTTRIALAFITLTLINTEKFGQYNYDYYNGHPPIQTVKNIAKVVNQYYPDTPLFTLEALYVAIDADREILPGLSMAQFSILNMDSEEAKELHFVSTEMVAETLNSPSTKVLILTEREIASLQSTIDGFDSILENNYMKVYQADHFGQKSVKAYVFVRK
jgi:hypothetical protein